LNPVGFTRPLRFLQLRRRYRL